MAYRRLETLLDCSVHGFNVKVTCTLCGRWRVIDAKRLFWHYRKNEWSPRVDLVHQHLRCAGCAHKEMTIILTEDDPTGPMKPRKGGVIGVVRSRD